MCGSWRCTTPVLFVQRRQRRSRTLHAVVEDQVAQILYRLLEELFGFGVCLFDFVGYMLDVRFVCIVVLFDDGLVLLLEGV